MNIRSRIHAILTTVVLIAYSIGCLSLAGAAEGDPDPKKVNLYALIVGVAEQEDKDLKLDKLNTEGAKEFFSLIAERKHLFSQVQVALLLDKQATKVNIMQVLTKELAKADKDDIVIIYLQGHGGYDPAPPGIYFFLPYDAKADDPGHKSVIRVNDKKLFENIKSERLLFLSGSCMSGGFLHGLARGKVDSDFSQFFGGLKGRYGIASSAADELSWWEDGSLSSYEFYLIKGLRGGADISKDGRITVKELYDYISQGVQKDTEGAQHPQLFASSKDAAAETPIYNTPTYKQDLNIDVKFFYETEDGYAKLLTEGAPLKSSAHVGVAFKPEADCYVHILWWDSSGNVGRLFPNPNLTEGEQNGFVKAGQSYRLPVKGGTRQCYVLDNNPGTETIYFVASRERSPKLENLYAELKASVAGGKRGGDRVRDVKARLEREINFMGFADYVVAKGENEPYANKEELVNKIEAKAKVAGGDAFYKLSFKHLAEAARYDTPTMPAPAAPSTPKATAEEACFIDDSCFAFTEREDLVKFCRLGYADDKEAAKALLAELRGKDRVKLLEEKVKVHVLHKEDTKPGELPKKVTVPLARITIDGHPDQELWTPYESLKCGDAKGGVRLRK